jgi:pimeloyl-ACP methyl ester carboxylesterase
MLAVLQSCAAAQTLDESLPRRTFFGVSLAPAEAPGVSVTAVLPDSTAAALGVNAGDLITAIDGKPVADPAAVVAALTAHRAGEEIVVDLARAGEELHFTTNLKTLPLETLPGSSVEYASIVTEDGYRLRTILSLPANTGTPAAAVLLLQGGGCGSIEGVPVLLSGSPPALMHALAAAGFATLRVEKPGVGDSAGPPCTEIGYDEELNAYRAALAALRARTEIDSSRIFLAGISLGGFFAPILANELPVAAIAAYGTIDFAPSAYPGRSERFFAEIASVDVIAAWRGVDVPVLVAHGEFDETTQAAWHEHIADTVNAGHPGRAVHVELPGLDHCASKHPSMDASRARCGQGEPSTLVEETLVEFFRGQLRNPGA